MKHILSHFSAFNNTIGFFFSNIYQIVRQKILSQKMPSQRSTEVYFLFVIETPSGDTLRNLKMTRARLFKSRLTLTRG